MRLQVLSAFLVAAAWLPQAHADAGTDGFNRWKSDFIRRWGAREVPAAFMREQLHPVTPNPKVIEIDRNQITSSKTANYREFMKKWLDSDPPRVATGKKMLEAHEKTLDQVERRYGVDRKAIIALWGVETLYGANKGSYPVIQSLATLAHEGRRRRFFESQLFSALKILHRGHISAEEFVGSWSGALGHCQFMPSSFEMIAVDFDGDGKKDIWNSIPDVLASIANYLQRAKWQRGLSIGELAFPEKPVSFDLERYRTPAQFHQLGLRAFGGRPLAGNWKRRAASIPLEDSPYVLRGSNYMSIMRWNNSSLFAAFVITLMDAF